MTIKIEKGIFTHSLFFFSIPGGDMFGAIQKDKEGWFATVRSRKYVDEFAHNSLDTKEWIKINRIISVTHDE